MTVASIVVLVAYFSLLLELVFLHVPSSASTLQILLRNQQSLQSYSSNYRKLFSLHMSIKLLLFVVPLLIIYGLFAFPLIVIFYGPNPLGDYLFAPTTVSQNAGLLLLIVGRVVTFSSVVALRTGRDRVGASYPLCTTGLFRWSRNPGLVGMYLFVAGIWLMMPSLAMALGIGIYIAYMDFKVCMEEDLLINTVGSAYVEYREQTGRYL